jgi:SulP family sulfate permease
MNPGVLEMIQRSPLGKALGRDGMHFNMEIAVEKYLAVASPGTDKN